MIEVLIFITQMIGFETAAMLTCFWCTREGVLPWEPRLALKCMGLKWLRKVLRFWLTAHLALIRQLPAQTDGRLALNGVHMHRRVHMALIAQPLLKRLVEDLVRVLAV